MLNDMIAICPFVKSEMTFTPKIDVEDAYTIVTQVNVVNCNAPMASTVVIIDQSELSFSKIAVKQILEDFPSDVTNLALVLKVHDKKDLDFLLSLSIDDRLNLPTVAGLQIEYPLPADAGGTFDVDPRITELIDFSQLGALVTKNVQLPWHRLETMPTLQYFLISGADSQGIEEKDLSKIIQEKVVDASYNSLRSFALELLPNENPAPRLEIDVADCTNLREFMIAGVTFCMKLCKSLVKIMGQLQALDIYDCNRLQYYLTGRHLFPPGTNIVENMRWLRLNRHDDLPQGVKDALHAGNFLPKEESDGFVNHNMIALQNQLEAATLSDEEEEGEGDTFVEEEVGNWNEDFIYQETMYGGEETQDIEFSQRFR